MKKFLVGLAGAMALAATASASNIYCAGVTSAAGVNTFIGGSPSNGAGTSTIDGTGLATLTCGSLGTVPLGFILTGITIGTTDDAQAPLDVNSIMSWNWTMTGGPAVTALVVSTVNQETSAGLSFNSCTTTTAGSPAIGCDSTNTFSLLAPLAAGAAIPGIVFTVASSAPTSDGLAPIGTTSASLYYSLVFTSTTSAPEPATFGLMGAALVGLGFIARKRKV